jgi:hypothetical protein
MEINNDVALGIRPPQVADPLTTLSRGISIADMASQIRERQQQAAYQQAETKLRMAQANQAQKAIDDQETLDKTVENHLSYDQDSGDLKYDDAGIAKDLTMAGKVHLLPKFQDQRDQMLKAHRDRAITELNDTYKLTDLMGTPAQNFMDLPDEEKAKQYPALVQTLAKADPTVMQKMPPQYGDDAKAKIQEIVDHRKQIKTVADNLAEAQAKEKLDLTAPEGREAEIARQVASATKQNGGKAPDQETIDAIREGVMQKAGFTGFKISRKTPGVLKQVGDTEGPNLPPGAKGIYGEDLDRSAGMHYAAVMHPNGEVVGYVQSNKQFAAKTPTAASLALAAANGDEKASRALQSLQTLRASTQQGSGLTDEAKDMLARNLVTTGSLPSMGMGAAKDREAIFNRAGEIAQGQNIAANSAEYKQLQTSTTALQKSFDAVTAFEKTATKNLDNAITAAKKLEDTGSPLLNRPLREIDRKVLGSADVAAYDAARQVAVNEIAKVTSNPTLSGQLSDTARKEVSDFLPNDATIQQISAVAQILKMDMENRRTFLNDQIDFNRKRIAGVGAPSPGTSKTPAATDFPVSAPNGKTYHFKTQKDADNFKASAGIK